MVVTVEHLSCSSCIKAGQLGRRRVEEKCLLLLLMLVQGVQVVGVLGRLEVTSQSGSIFKEIRTRISKQRR